MKLPRGVSAARLIRALEHLGYETTRQKGSHVPDTPIHLKVDNCRGGEDHRR